MEHGRAICKTLKELRKRIADANGIPFEIEECTYQNSCKGTCPKCDSEMKYLQEAIDERKRQGYPVILTELMSEAELLDNISSQQNQNTENDIEDNYNSDDLNEYNILEGDIMPPDEDANKISITAGMPMPHDLVNQYDDQEELQNENKRSLYKTLPIAGTAYHGIEDIWDELHVGTRLALVRDKHNKYDSNAVAVVLESDYDGDPDNFDSDFIIGYVPRAENSLIAQMMDMGWTDVFTAEITSIKNTGPMSVRLLMSVYIQSKEQTEKVHDFHAQIIDAETASRIKKDLFNKGFVYFRWGGFPPWERTLPEKGDKVIFVYNKGDESELFLMNLIASGDDSAMFLDDKSELYCVDDCCPYILTNIAGPTNHPQNNLSFLDNLDIDTFQPETVLPKETEEILLKYFNLE